jgi:hypothetical protein
VVEPKRAGLAGQQLWKSVDWRWSPSTTDVPKWNHRRYSLWNVSNSERQRERLSSNFPEGTLSMAQRPT